MSICLCCQRKIENEIYYHRKCLKKLFGTEKIPAINFASIELISEISKNVGRMSISGVQIKASIILNKKKNSIEIVQKGGTYILKPEPGEYPGLPQNENLCMNLAEVADMEVPPHGLFYLTDRKLCYIVKRFDRDNKGQKIHVEDMAQLLKLPSDSKYEASLETVGNAILKFSSRPYLDLIYFFERVIFCFLIGNGDMHLKNWSLISDKEGNYRLSPCYDLICSKLYLLREDQSALTINGKRNKISISDFISLAEYLRIDKKAYRNVFDKMQNLKDLLLEMVENANYFEMADKVKEIIVGNYEKLFK
ncbi:MAG: type II toxin-antitoxin system HipA family toxin [Candidatus Humimicrobiaceae bacterium]